MRILISAGEASGEMYGAQLMEALRRRTAELRSAGEPGAAVPTETLPDPAAKPQKSAAPAQAGPEIEFFGAGGEKMRAAGCDIVVDAKDLSVVGITEILGHLPKIWRLFHKLIGEADKRKPDLAIVIDSPAFNWRVAREMRKRGVPVVYYVAPQFWAWRQGRVKLLRKNVSKALVIFPFEEKFFCERGVDATFVGHPLAELSSASLPREAADRGKYAGQHGLDAEKHWITLMPGSRVKEVGMNLPTMLEAAAQFGRAYEFVLPMAPTLERSFLQPLLAKLTTVRLVPEALAALYHSRAGIIASGTATVEAAMMATPFVMVYRVTPLTYLLGRGRVKVSHFAMVNLIAGEEVVPELVQQDFTAAKVVAELNQILPDGPARDRMLEGLAGVKARLRGNGGAHPAERAAEAVLSVRGMSRAV
ncbi:MAG TPA: lipid-A-disaccharide synthase [Terriglobales bacterium]|nr:lipid-A-disaccharide synthase [Terriglobales bacterium]